MKSIPQSSLDASGPLSRRQVLQTLGFGAVAVGLPRLASAAQAENPPIQGFERTVEEDASKGWMPFSDRKIRVGLVGYGTCHFSAIFGFQDHPNVEVVAVSDLIPDRCAALAKHARCNKTYPSLEEMVKDDRIEAIFVATDAPSHARHCIEVLKHGKHVGSAVSCLGRPSNLPSLNGGKNRYQNPFGTQVGFFRTSEGGMARILTTKDTPGFGAEAGRVRGTRGAFFGEFKSADNKLDVEKAFPNTKRPPLPRRVATGGHGGSHGFLMNEFVTSIIQDRKPLVHIAMALNLTVPGVVAHQSALKGGEWAKIPQYRL